MKSIAGAIFVLAAFTAGTSDVLFWPLLLLSAGYIITDWFGYYWKLGQ